MNKNNEKAIEILKKAKLVDGHMDLAEDVFNRHQLGEDHVIERHYLENFKRAKVKLIVVSIFVNDHYLNDFGLVNALEQIAYMKKEILDCEDLQLIKSAQDLEAILKNNQIGMLLSLEGLEPISNHITLLETFYELGIRAAGLTWSRRNFVGEGSYFGNPKKGVAGGLSPFGVEVIEKMNALNMLIDISHLNDPGLKDVIAFSQAPFYASHSNARAVNALDRNLPDWGIIALKEKQSVIGVNGIIPIVDASLDMENTESSVLIEHYCRHIDYYKHLIGSEYIGLGLDICGVIEANSLSYGKPELGRIDVFERHSDILNLVEALLERGYHENEILGILGENMLNFFMNFYK